MIAFLRQWLLGVIACALVVSFAEQICPQGVARRVLRFAGGLLLLLAILSPLRGIDRQFPGGELSNYRETIARLTPEYESVRDAALENGIAAELGTYIEDKAAAMGAQVRVEVEVDTRNGRLIPVRVRLYGARPADYVEQQLSAAITETLGIAREQQLWMD